MALQGSGPIWLSQIQAEFGGPNYWLSTYYRGAGYVTNGAGNQGVPAGGAIYLSHFFNTYKTFAGSYDRTSNISSTTVTVPPHSWLRMRVWGAGGGGGDNTANGSPGGLSRVSGYLTGAGGKGGYAYPTRTGGAGGDGSGGNYANNSGGDGATPPIADGTGGKGGNGALGGSGGSPSRANAKAANGGSPGGGGGGANTSGGGGGGGYSRSEFGAANSTLTFTVTVGNGGAGGGSYGGSGADGRVLIEWGV